MEEKEYNSEKETKILEKESSKNTQIKFKTFILLVFIIVFLFGIGVLLFLKGNQKDNSQQKEEFSKNENTTEEATIPEISYTLDDVVKHNTKEDCWLVISGKVYDVTDFVNRHPGKDSILEGCGKDATELFLTRPMGSKTPHSKKAQEMLSEFLIGKLKEN